VGLAVKKGEWNRESSRYGPIVGERMEISFDKNVTERGLFSPFPGQNALYPSTQCNTRVFTTLPNYSQAGNTTQPGLLLGIVIVVGWGRGS